MYTLFKSRLNRFLYRLWITSSNKRDGVPLNILISWCQHSTIESSFQQNFFAERIALKKVQKRRVWEVGGCAGECRNGSRDGKTKETGEDRYLYTKIIGKGEKIRRSHERSITNYDTIRRNNTSFFF